MGGGTKAASFSTNSSGSNATCVVSITPAVPETVQDAAIRHDGQAFRGYWRAGSIATELFQLAPGLGGNADVRMQADAGHPGAALTGWDGRIFRFDLSSKRRDAITRARAGGNAPLHRCPIELGEQRLIAKQGVCFIRLRTGPQSAALEQSDNAAGNASRHSRDFGIAGRGQPLKTNPLPLVRVVDAVEHQAMKMDVCV